MFCFRHLSRLTSAFNEFDAVINHIPLTEFEKTQTPFVGNGKLASIADYDQPSLYLFVTYNEYDDYKVSSQTDPVRYDQCLM